MTLATIFRLNVITHDFIVCEKLTKSLKIGLDISHKHSIGCDWSPDRKLCLHKSNKIIISHVECDAKSNLILLHKSVTLEAYKYTVILIKLANPLLPVHDLLYEFHHNDLLDDSNVNLKVAGAYHYQASSKRKCLSFMNLGDKSIHQAAETIARSL